MPDDRPSKRARRGRGEGGVRFDSKRKLWVASVSLGYLPDGRRNRPVAYAATKRGALEELDRLRAGASAGAPDSRTLTVAQLLARWLAAGEGRLARRTHENRLVGSGLVGGAIGGRAVRSLTALDVENFHVHLKGAAAPSRAWLAAVALSGALRHAVRLGVIESSPADRVGVPPMRKREMQTLTAPQARALLAATEGYSFFPLLSAALASGCRQGELLALGWDDVDLGAGVIFVRRSLSFTRAHGYEFKPPKTAAARRTVRLPPSALDALAGHRAGREREGRLGRTVFSSRGGGYQGRGPTNAHLKRAIDRANRSGAAIPRTFRFHDLRHTHASLLLSGGHSLRAVSARLGHSDPALTLRVYAHCLPGDDDRLADGIGAILG